MTTTSSLSRKLRGKHVLTVLLGFFFVMFAVNGVFVYYALTTFNGVETQDAYRSGLAYNTRIAEAERQESRDWRGQVTLSPETRKLSLVLADGAGFPVPGLTIAAGIGRPATDRFDTRLALSEIRPGTYEAEVPSLGEGNWIVDIEARQTKGTALVVAYRLKERLWLKPRK